MKTKDLPVTAKDLRDLPDEQVQEILNQLGPQKAKELKYTWEFWARPEQLEPKGKYKIWMPLAGRGWGKDLADETPIFTNNGWKTMGELRVGDYVFAWDGSATKVVNLYKPTPRQLVEFTFSDNTTIVSSVEHEWVTQDRKERRSKSPWPSGGTRTTQDIIETFTYGSRDDTNHSIPLCKPLNGTRQGREVVEPYYLGFWLGDGISKSCHEITIGPEDQGFYLNLWPQFEDKGNLIFRAPTEQYQWMRDLNLRCNKHIPEIVFHCIPAVRLEVLKGLMDSDGYAEKSKVEFCSTSAALANGVLQLARSLGEKPRIYISESKFYGKNCGLKYRVCWKPNLNPFKLPRKANKVRIGGNQDSRNRQRMIVSYKYVDYRPTTCIEVDHPDHLFLAGEGLIPTHNTRTGAETVRGWVKQGLKRIACVAPTKGDVRRVMVEGESGLLSVCSEDDQTYRGVRMGKPLWQPTNNTITWENGAKVEFFSAEDPERLRGPQFHAAWCFTAGHYVDTPYGKILVEKLTPGYLVETSQGPKRITHTSERNMPVGVVEFSDGITLEGTYDHPIYTQRGWVPLGELKESDVCLKLNMMDTSGELTPKVTTIRQAKELFTAMLLKKSMATFPGMTYTTSTVTNSTTIQVTSNSSPDQSTSNCTTGNEVCQSANQKVKESFLAIAAAKLWSGSKSLVKGFTAKVVNIVGLKKKGRLSKPVVSAEKVSGRGWELCAVSVASTWQPTGVKPVYNLRVENTHEYFCNGILTHNCDELAAWRNVQEVWDMLQFTLRLGNNPKILITTTPKPIKIIRRIVDQAKEESDKYVVTVGSSYDNADNIDLDALKAYEGTRLGRQELYAEILEESAGALWSMELLDKAQIFKEDVPLLDDQTGYSPDNLNLQRIVVAVDPAITSNEESDMTGIVVAGIDVNGIGYVLEDATDNYKPAEWAQKAIDLFYKYKADRVVAERNQGGDMVRHTLQTEDPSVPLRLVHASRGKYARAEPVSALYEQSRVKHLPGLDDLERQMTIWEPLGKMGSPDRLDACVWALTDLMLGGVARPQLTLSYKNAKEAAA